VAAGRKATPTALKLVTGNPGKRALNKKEPKLAPGVPRMPSHLSPRAKAAWKKLAKLLKDMGVLTLADGMALERLCDVYAEILELRDEIKKNGRTYQSVKIIGENVDEETKEFTQVEQMLMKANPAVQMLADADRRFKGYLVEFGLTPSARSKVQVTDGSKKKEDLDEFFG
jgi:P27 family predicted phage terminase small subunit